MRLRNLFSKHRRDKSSVDGRTKASTPSNIDAFTSKLPDDIIYEIFEMAALVYPPRLLTMMPSAAKAVAHTNSLLGWVVLTHICQRWRSIGLSASLAPLWSRVVCLSWKPTVAKQLADRARDCKLTIDLSRFNGTYRAPGDCLPLEDWAYWNISRVSVLISPSTALLDRLKTQRLVLPNLHEIRLGALWLPPDFNPLWDMPGLSTARLCTTLLPVGLVTALRELHLRVNVDHLALTKLRTFLRACLKLEILDVLVLGQWSHDDDPWDTRLENVRIPLERLKRAKVVVSGCQAAMDLWGPIHGSPGISFELIVEMMGKFRHETTPRPVEVLEVCKKELDCALYDCLDLHLLGGGLGRSDMRLRLSSSSSSASCELKFPTDESTRKTLFSLLASYISAAAPFIRMLRLNALEASSVDIDEVYSSLGRTLVGVKQLELRGIDFWSTAFHIRALRQSNPAPVFPGLQSVQLSNVDLLKVQGPQLYMTRQWWDIIVSALGARKGPLERLTMNGDWAGKERWNEDEDREGMEDVKAKSVLEVIDGRRWA